MVTIWCIQQDIPQTSFLLVLFSFQIISFAYVNVFRWVKNEKAADRLIEILDNSQVFKFWPKLPKSKQHQSKSYRTVQDALNNPFTSSKLKFFSFASDIVESFLKKYQADKPMTPSLDDSRKKLFKIT